MFVFFRISDRWGDKSCWMEFKMQNRMWLSELKEGMHRAPSSRTEGRVIAKLTSSSCFSLLGAHFSSGTACQEVTACVCVFFSIIAVSYMWLLITLNIVGATECLNCYPSNILIFLNGKDHMFWWLPCWFLKSNNNWVPLMYKKPYAKNSANQPKEISSMVNVATFQMQKMRFE